ncbi:PREDICTED: uncharacterized protein LOC104804221 [Tarenaya hassleriana]|uniref:uncharacterized protein LOC104804221 n=1 Tax=Tarenaya hassleriana TaxID=28532 RepID=UPI00053C752C|nr:PREDICTED: uncharacterized protein LOC104804221 [Tarenaya hassleriana]
MGICSSCDSSHVVATAKLILQDGGMMEFTQPVKVGYVLQKYPTCFICDSDEMDFDDVVSAISADEELQLGHLYFALPLSWLRRPLQAEEMAALAVKANSALTRSGGCRREKCQSRLRCASSVVYPADEFRRRSASGDGTVGSSVGSRKGSSSGGRRRLPAKLSRIEE